MVSWGLLGAIGGAGKGLEKVGASLEERRERALQAARRLAEQQEAQRVRQEEKQEDREFRRTERLDSERATDERTERQIAARREITETTLDHRSTEAERNRNHQTELVRLRGRVARSNDAASVRLRRELAKGDTAGVVYGEPDKNGVAEVFRMTKSGQVVSTGARGFVRGGRPSTSSGAGYTGLPDVDDEDD